MLMRLQQRVMNAPEILVCFLSGSFGRREADPFSDMDVALVYGSAAARDGAWQQRRDFVQSIMPYVPAKSFDAVHVRPFFHVALYGNGSKVDYRFEVQSELAPSIWDQNLRLLKDTDNWGSSFEAACKRAPAPRPHLTLDELVALDDRFWVMYWDVLRVLLRGDYQKPFTVYLELLHFTLPPLLRVLAPTDPAHRALLVASYSEQVPVTRAHMQQLHRAYVAARTAVVQQLKLDFTPHHRFEEQMQRLLQKVAD